MIAVTASNPVNVLLVDDTPAKLLTYEVILDGLGQNLIKANSADEAFQALLKNDVALVVADVSMPTIDGFEFAKIVRAHPRFGTTPIIFVTANALSDLDRLQGYACGAVDYVTVPVVPEVLRAKVNVFVELHRRQRKLEQLKSELERRVEERTAELAKSEQRYRALVDNANDVVATLDLEGRLTSVNPAVERILGYTPQELIGTFLSRFVPEGEVSTHENMLKRKLQGEPSTQYEMQLLSRDGRHRFTLEVNSKLILDGDGRPAGVHSIARDITERKEAEARQLVLIRELQHRTKNLLAVIQSIATSTLTGSADLKAAQQAFLGRLHALAHAQEFVAAGPRGGAPLRDLVDSELLAFPARAVVNGEDLVVGGAFAQTFALVTHELATNAVRHGSLSTPRGGVRIAWNVDRSGPEPQLQFSWVERGGPPASPPKESGLGTRLISMVGISRMAFTNEGFEYGLTVPLAEAIRGSE
jgi:PAS domain S-box-containing protein